MLASLASICCPKAPESALSLVLCQICALAAAQTKFQAGALDDALVLLDLADAGSPREGERARVDLLRAQIAFASQRVGDAAPLLLKAARAASLLPSVNIRVSPRAA